MGRLARFDVLRRCEMSEGGCHDFARICRDPFISSFEKSSYFSFRPATAACLSLIPHRCRAILAAAATAVATHSPPWKIQPHFFFSVFISLLLFFSTFVFFFLSCYTTLTMFFFSLFLPPFHSLSALWLLHSSRGELCSWKSGLLFNMRFKVSFHCSLILGVTCEIKFKRPLSTR